MGYRLKERTYLDRTGTRVVAEDDPEVGVMLGRAGQEIDESLAAKLGLDGADEVQMRATRVPGDAGYVTGLTVGHPLLTVEERALQIKAARRVEKFDRYDAIAIAEAESALLGFDPKELAAHLSGESYEGADELRNATDEVRPRTEEEVRPVVAPVGSGSKSLNESPERKVVSGPDEKK